MGQQPNIEITLADLPVAGPEPAAAAGWAPTRPGDLNGPGEVPWGGAYGRPGPDAGFARILAASAELELGEGERRRDAEAAVAAVASARSSHFGRAPVKGDIEVAAILLGYAGDGPAGSVADRRTARRLQLVGDLARQPHNAADLLDAIPLDALIGDADAARIAVADGLVL